MEFYSDSISNLIEQLAHLPGIGRKTARRLAFYIIGMPEEEVNQLTNAITTAKKKIKYCKQCCTITDLELCPICSDVKRNQNQIMVVESSKDLAAYEKTGGYEGVYHVLQGVIDPLKGVGPNDIKLKELMERLSKIEVQEVIIATGSTLEGEATAMYISQLLKPTGIKVTRIASGVPVGGDLECIDEMTLIRAFEGRTQL